MIRVEANRDTCSGFATCIASAPDIFDLDEEGLVTVLISEAEDIQLEAVRQAAYDCPTDSISFTTDA